MFDYQKLKARIMEIYKTQAAFAEAMDMSLPALNQRLNGAIEWKTPEIVKACGLLHIDLAEAHLYFFNRKVQKTTLKEVYIYE